MMRSKYVFTVMIGLGVVIAAVSAQQQGQKGASQPVKPASITTAPKPAANATKPPEPVFNKAAITGPGVFLQSNVGSFKIKKGSEQSNVGILDMTFKGTVLVSGLKGSVNVGNGARLEFQLKDRNKAVYFSPAVGKMHVEGVFDAIQFFGQNVNATYRGTGVIQLFGEFDKNLNTGYYWYGSAPNDKKYWGTGGTTITPVPFKMPGEVPQDIKVKDVTGKG